MKPKNVVMLMTAAFIWGTAFVAQSVGMDYLGPFTFNGVRNFVGAAALLPCIWLLDRLNRRDVKDKAVKEAKNPGEKRDLILGGVSCGTVLFVAGSFQQVGLQYTTVGKA